MRQKSKMQFNTAFWLSTLVFIAFNFKPVRASAVEEKNITDNSSVSVLRPDGVNFLNLVGVNQNDPARIRICAGAGLLDGVHSMKVEIQLTRQEGLTRNNWSKRTKISLRFTGFNYDAEGFIAPRLYNEAGTDIITPGSLLETKEDGRLVFHILSSNVVSQTLLEVNWNNVAPIGHAICVFSGPLNLRRFGVKDYIESVDDGWIFNQGVVLAKPGVTAPAKVYLKHQKALTAADDKYFIIKKDMNGDGNVEDVPSLTLDADGDGEVSEEERNEGVVRRPLDDDGNWSFVNGHRLKIRISEIIRSDGEIVDPENYGEYLSLVIAEGGAYSVVDSVEGVTEGDGAVQVWLKSFSRIYEVESVTLEAEDQTAIEEEIVQ